jgi:histidinol-phosphatase (PHP family)
MKYLQNLHTHCTYCDGKDTPEEMIRFALEKGFDSLGFSCHSFNQYSSYAAAGIVSREKIGEYHRRIPQLKEQYRDQIKLWFGIEYEYCCGEPMADYDYIIGASHYVPTCDGWKGFDSDATCVKNLINDYFGGDGMAFAKSYYEVMAKLPELGKVDIIAHFDIITKNLEKAPGLFDADCKAYMDCALGAMEALRGKIPFFEVNTGAISRGWKTLPYPAPFLLEELHRLGGRVMLNSDSHAANTLDCAFPDALERIRAAGFTKLSRLTENGMVEDDI